jgi:hypothetical protein
MMKRAIWVVVLAAGLIFAGVAQAQEDAPWLHIRVDESGAHGSKVSVNVPLSLVEVVLDIAENEIFEESHFDIDHSDITVADMRRMWDELRNAGDAEFVTVEEDDEFIKISRQGSKVLIEMQDLDDDSEKGRIEVPVGVVDALFSGEGEDLNIRAALDELIRTQDGEIVMIEDDETSVRIWIE